MKAREKGQSGQLPLRFPESDSLTRVSRSTLHSVAELLGLNETQAVHYALRRLADEILPKYEREDGPLSDEHIEAIRSMESQRTVGEPLSSLF